MIGNEYDIEVTTCFTPVKEANLLLSFSRRIEICFLNADLIYSLLRYMKS